MTYKIVMEWLDPALLCILRASKDARSLVLAIISWGEILGSCAIEQDNGDNLQRGFAQKITHPCTTPMLRSIRS